MIEIPLRIRQPLYSAARPEAAARCYDDNPAPLIEAMYRRIWETSMHDMPFVNSALSVQTIGFARHQGDWVGAVISPWFINLLLLPGGGSLWADAASGDRVRVAFPVGELEFIADYDPGGDMPAYQYCTLFAPVSQFTVQESAVAAAEAALTSLLTAPPTPTVAAQPVIAEAADAMPAESAPPDRRAFLRLMAGRRKSSR